MSLADLDDVVRIENASFPAPWTRSMFTNEIMNPSSVSLVFRRGTALLGYRCHWVVVDEAHLMTIAVDPAYRNQGVGAFMMAHLEADCLAAGLSRIFLEVSKENPKARRLYRKHGFVTVGFRKNYYGLLVGDALVMEKVLTAKADSGSESKGAEMT
jgi:[ribosomal protein S18]-alanine N-acetyltransferase